MYFYLPSPFPPQVSNVYSVQSLAIRQKITGRLNPRAFSLSEMFWTKTLIRLVGKISWNSTAVTIFLSLLSVPVKMSLTKMVDQYNMIYSLTTTLVSRCGKPFLPSILSDVSAHRTEYKHNSFL